MSHKLEPERALFVHAHPDDESISTGGTIARLRRTGEHVTVLTLTRGELGEVVPGALKSLEGTSELATRREAELRAAMAALGVTDHRFLGNVDARSAGKSPRIYRDSGMVWDENGHAGPRSGNAYGSPNPQALIVADFDEVCDDLLLVVDTVNPTVIVSYDENGGYGHPDHIVAHKIAVEAGRRRGIPVWVIDKRGTFDVELCNEDFRRKREAMAAHASQLTLDGDHYVLSGGQKHELASTETFRLAASSLPGNTAQMYFAPLGEPVSSQAVSEDTVGSGPASVSSAGIAIPAQAIGLAGSKAETGSAPDAQSNVDRGVGAAAQQRRSVWTGIWSCVLAGVAGVVFGALGTTVHQTQIDLTAEVSIPVGMIIALVSIAGLIFGMRVLVRERLAVVFCAVGLIGIVAAFSFRGQGGSVLIPDNVLGVTWTLAPAIIAILVVMWPRLPRAFSNSPTNMGGTP